MHYSTTVPLQIEVHSCVHHVKYTFKTHLKRYLRHKVHICVTGVYTMHTVVNTQPYTVHCVHNNQAVTAALHMHTFE